MIVFLLVLFGWATVAAEILDLKIGANCTALGGVHGICRLLTKCETVDDFKEKQPPICSFKGTEPIICCPMKQTSTVKPGYKVKRFCAWLNHEYNRLVKKRLDMDKQIPGIGGTVVTSMAHPYMAVIGYCSTEKKYCDESEVTWACGGSLINKKYVLSAAHCGYIFDKGPARWARLGDLDISTSADDDKAQNKTIIDIIVYPKYQSTQAYHDIALFKLDSDVDLSFYVLPVCLQTERHIEQKKANFTGWGRTGPAEGTSDKLLEGELDIYNDTECKRLMFSKDSSKAPLGYQPDLMFCAGVPDGSRDTCPGDSGGPLVTFETIGNKTLPYQPQKIQIGITSYGNLCGSPDSPGVYTRVSHYISWIEEVAFKDINDLRYYFKIHSYYL